MKPIEYILTGLSCSAVVIVTLVIVCVTYAHCKLINAIDKLSAAITGNRPKIEG